MPLPSVPISKSKLMKSPAETPRVAREEESQEKIKKENPESQRRKRRKTSPLLLKKLPRPKNLRNKQLPNVKAEEEEAVKVNSDVF